MLVRNQNLKKENNSMKIHYKFIEHERFEDAPFVGALISAIDCHFNCKGCFNQYLKTQPTLEKSCEEIIQEIKNNPFNEGIILGGLEWTEQPEEAIDLIISAIAEGLKVMLYTGYTEEEFIKKFPEIYYSTPMYIKFGKYDENQKTNSNVTHQVKLATSNQIIKEI